MRREQRIGKHGQHTAAAVLAGRCGINMVEQIGTPVILIPVATPRRNTYQVIFGEKVSGDHRGLIGNGVSVLAETKTILDRNLRYSDLREHQPARLSAHANYGGISLLVWVNHPDVYVMQWPIKGFEAGKSITREQALELNAETVAFLNQIRIDHEREIEQLARDLEDVITEARWSTSR